MDKSKLAARITLTEKSIGFLLATAFVTHAFDVGLVFPEHGRAIVKLISLMLISICFILVLMSPQGRRVSRYDATVILITVLCFICIFVLPESATSQSEAIMQMGKVLGVFMMLWTLMARPQIASRVTRTMLLYGLLLAAIGIYSLFSPLNSNEKMPVINIMSSRSLFFEQNVFGIFMFFCFIYMLRYRAMVYQNAIFLGAIFSSFYRTVWAMAFIGSVSIIKLRYALLLVLMSLTVIAFNFDLLFSAFKLSQIGNLTGRSELWVIAATGFFESPIVGQGFSQIPEYSNSYLNRTRPYTTFHNIIFDTLFASGILGGIALIVLCSVFFTMIGKRNFFFGLLLLSPSMFNTFFPFSPNVLGGFIAAYSISEKFKRASGNTGHMSS